MKQFVKTSKFGGKKDFGPKKFGKREFSRDGARPERKSFSSSGDRPRFGADRPELFKTECGICGKEAIVPFRPLGNKPVLCKICFSKKDSSEPRADRFDSRGKPPFSSRPRFDARPVARPAGFSSDSRPSAPSDSTLDQINRKLDKIMRALKIE
ncbi:MAG: hypothetical protein MUF22_09895 [Chitinispirillaceae bacterium]|jgi:CxxC-x17-CxxC domain-containing protein|nr:hypothetical protein [Chitinispirillaceae bacterium]